MPADAWYGMRRGFARRIDPVCDGHVPGARPRRERRAQGQNRALAPLWTSVIALAILPLLLLDPRLGGQLARGHAGRFR